MKYLYDTNMFLGGNKVTRRIHIFLFSFNLSYTIQFIFPYSFYVFSGALVAFYVFRSAHGVMSQKMESENQVQILDETLHFS